MRIWSQIPPPLQLFHFTLPSAHSAFCFLWRRIVRNGNEAACDRRARGSKLGRCVRSHLNGALVLFSSKTDFRDYGEITLSSQPSVNSPSLKSLYRVTHHVESNLLLTSKQKFLLVWGPCSKTQLLFWCQREVCINVICHPVHIEVYISVIVSAVGPPKIDNISNKTLYPIILICNH